jgi:hypothetical protein
MLRDKEGHQLFRKVSVKVIFPDAVLPERTYVQHAGPHQGFGPDGVDGMLNQIADQLDTLYPWWEFEPIELKPEGRTARWVFKFAKYRATESVATDITPIESKAPEPEAVAELSSQVSEAGETK